LRLGPKPFGKDVANVGLYQALARFGRFDHIVFLVSGRLDPRAFRASLLGDKPCTAKISSANVLYSEVAARAGNLFRGSANLSSLAWQRRGIADHAYSLVGMIHTIAPPGIRDQIAAVCTAPVQPWDALICTSLSVRTGIEKMLIEWSAYLADRYDGNPQPLPQLPVIPLGVDCSSIEAAAERGDVRANVRERLGLKEKDVLVLWVGRMSFFEKAYPQPMLQAVELARQATGATIHFAMTGWFPEGAKSEEQYREAAKLYAPSVPVHFLDGQKAHVVAGMWAAGDIFLSLVDNIQETFGISPIEAMAAGLPVVVSDWDGYRSTVLDGVTGFLIPTLGPPPGDGNPIAMPHVLGLESYQVYVGTVAQYTAVHIGRAASALAHLIQDPTFRRAMGQNGRNHVRSNFDWPIIVRQLEGLFDELDDMRRRQSKAALPTPIADPVKGDPFSDFAHFASSTMSADLILRPGRLGTDEALRECTLGSLDRFASSWRLTTAECAAILDNLTRSSQLSVCDVLARFPEPKRLSVKLALMWMCKRGFVDWTD